MRLVESVDAVSVVVEEESSDVDEVHGVAFGKGERLAGEPANALAQREIEAFDMVCLPFLFGTSAVLVVGHNVLIGAPEVGEDQPTFISGWNLVPELSATTHRARAMMPGDHLSGATAQRDPQPDLVFLAADITP